MKRLIMGGTSFSGSGLFIDIVINEYNGYLPKKIRLAELSTEHKGFSLVDLLFIHNQHFATYFRYLLILILSLFKNALIYYPLVAMSSILKLFGKSIKKGTGFLSSGINKSHAIEYSIISSLVNLFILHSIFFRLDDLSKKKVVKFWFNLKTRSHNAEDLVIYDKSIPDNLIGATLLTQIIPHYSILFVRNPILQLIQQYIANDVDINSITNEKLEIELLVINKYIERTFNMFNNYNSLIVISFDRFISDQQYKDSLLLKTVGCKKNSSFNFDNSISNNEILIKIRNTMDLNQTNIELSNNISLIQDSMVIDSLVRLDI